MLKVGSFLLALSIAAPAFAASPYRGGIGPVRVINQADARQAVKAAITAKYGAIKGLRITLTNTSVATDTFRALGPKTKGAFGDLRFSAEGTVVQGAGTKAKVVSLPQLDM